MKKTLILAAVAAVALSACSKNEIIETINKVPEEVAIGFSNYTPKTLSKANDTYVSGTTLVSGKHFGVYAWQTANGTFLDVTPGTPDFMNPVDVTWAGDTGSGETNTYSPLRYWPSGDTPANLSFAAYYPYGGAGITAPTFATGVGTYAFTAQSAPADMVDFCVADVVNDQVYGSTNAGSSYKGTVKFTFKHQLTKVQFKFKTTEAVSDDANTTINLVEAKLNNVKTKGTLSATYALASPQGVNKLGTTTTAWSDQALAATPVVYDVTLNTQDPSSSNKIELTKTASTVANADIFLMVPQAMVDKAGIDPQYLEVTWEVITDGVTTTNTQKLYFKNDVYNGDDPDATGYAQEDIDWGMNNFITYTITIGPKPIYFTAAVTGWDAEENGYMNVN